MKHIIISPGSTVCGSIRAYSIQTILNRAAFDANVAAKNACAIQEAENAVPARFRLQ